MCATSRTCTPGPEADAIVEELLAKGNYQSADKVVFASLQLRNADDPCVPLAPGDGRSAAACQGA